MPKRSARVDGQGRISIGRYLPKGTEAVTVEVDAEGYIIIRPVRKMVIVEGHARKMRDADGPEDGLDTTDPDFPFDYFLENQK